MNAAKIFLSQFSSPLIYVLAAAGAVTALIGDTVDAWVIGAAVALNTLLGFFQEYKADRSLAALKKFLVPKAKVIRNGQRQLIKADEVAVGDICVLEVGERVPADGKLIEAQNLSFNEAVLTGESVPVRRRAGETVYMGTTVNGGIGKMRVAKTGAETKFGQIAASLKETREPATPLQQQLAQFSKKLTLILGVICAAIFGLGLWRGDSLMSMFITSVAVAVAAIPEGLVISLTVILSLGMQRILKRKALVRKLLAAETLGSVTVICCDKTGTLTEGKMKVVKVLTDNEPRLRQAAVLCNDMRDPLELPMLEWGRQDSVTVSQCHNLPRLTSIPFDHEKKYIATLHPGILFVSGAPEVLLGKSELEAHQRQAIIRRLAAEAKKGYRLVGFAYKKVSRSNRTTVSHRDIKDLIWLGVLVYADPIRPGVKAVLDRARSEGIKVKLITGDYQETALAVAKQLGIAPGDVYSRIDPQEKLKIVKELQEQGEVVAMTGDGVNDAPALKKADIGIVVAEASAVATETADMVLLDSNLATILAAVEEGRLIFANLTKVLYYLMANAFVEVAVIAGSLAMNWPLPLTAAQILWINLVNDSWPTFALAVDPAAKIKKRRLFDRQTQLSIALVSGVTGLLALILFSLYRSQSLVFTLIAVAPLIYSLAIGSLKNLWLWLAVAVGLSLQMLVLYQPGLQAVFKTSALGLQEWLLVAGGSVMIMVIMRYVRR
jgi:Ca2+-transporting ATPase